MKRPNVRTVALGLLLGACTEPPRPQVQEDEAAVVYGADDRREYYAHPDAVLRSRARESTVALIRPDRIDTSNPRAFRIDHLTLGQKEALCTGEPFSDQPAGASCSGTLVDWDIVLTAGHCVEDLDECQGRWFIFDYLYEAQGRLAVIEPEDVFRCRRIVARRDIGGIDYAFVQLDRPAAPPRSPAPIDLSARPVSIDDAVSIVGFPDGIPLKIASGGRVIDDGAPRYEDFEATLDSFSGNSGSGVYNAAGELVGILANGQADYVARGGCFVVNRLPDDGAEGRAEGVSYIQPGLGDLCQSGFGGRLCGDNSGTCRPCADDSICPAGWSCRSATMDGVTWCASPCATNADCPRAHACIRGGCDPSPGRQTCSSATTVGAVNSCGRTVNIEACNRPFEICVDAACQSAPRGNACHDPIEISAADRLMTGDPTLLSAESEGGCGGEGAEVVFAVDVPTAGRLVATSEGYDTVLYLRTACGDTSAELACNDDEDFPDDLGSRIEVDLTPGRVFLFLDAYESTEDEWVLDVRFTPVTAGPSGDAASVSSTSDSSSGGCRSTQTTNGLPAPFTLLALFLMAVLRPVRALCAHPRRPSTPPLRSR